jgi:hypothetical protein
MDPASETIAEILDLEAEYIGLLLENRDFFLRNWPHESPPVKICLTVRRVLFIFGKD